MALLARAGPRFVAESVLSYAEQIDRLGLRGAERVELTPAEHDDIGGFWFFVIGHARGRRMLPHAVRGVAGAASSARALAEAYRTSMMHELRRRGFVVEGPLCIDWGRAPR